MPSLIRVVERSRGRFNVISNSNIGAACRLSNMLSSIVEEAMVLAITYLSLIRDRPAHYHCSDLKPPSF